MKKWLLTTAICVSVFTAVAYVSAQDQAAKPEPKKSVIIGEVISIAHWAMEGGAHGEEHAAAMRYQIEKGFPVGILEEETNQLYIPVYRDNAPASSLEAANKALLDLVGKVATVQGMVYEQNGVKVIRISLASEF